MSTTETMRSNRPGPSFAQALLTNASTFIVQNGSDIRSPCTEAQRRTYKLVKVLGYGNMGTVFLAHAEHLDTRARSEGFCGEAKLECPAHAAPGIEIAELERCAHVAGTGIAEKDDNLHNWVALKVMSKETLSKRNCSRRAEMEVECLSAASNTTALCDGGDDEEALQTSRSPFLPCLRDRFETSEHRVLVMDFCVGGNLNSLRHRQRNKTFSVAAARFYAAEVVLALERLHALGFVYRDLKPENVLIRSTGHIMLTDFDLCLRMPPRENPSTGGSKKRLIHSYATVWKSLLACSSSSSSANQYNRRKPSPNSGMASNSSSKARVTPLPDRDSYNDRSRGKYARSKSFVGTEEYVAPEVLWGTGHGHAVDWWALGVLLYEMVYGTAPFRSQSQPETFFNILCKEPRFHAKTGLVDDDDHQSCGIRAAKLSDLDAGDLIKDLMARLLMKDPAHRLGSEGGANAVKSHAFFRGVCWQALPSLAATPFIPTPRHHQAAELDDVELVNLEEHLARAERLRYEAAQSRLRSAAAASSASAAEPARAGGGAGGRPLPFSSQINPPFAT